MIKSCLLFERILELKHPPSAIRTSAICLYIRSMNRYFLEVSYKGKGWAGFQIQQNAPTIQYEIEKALATFFRQTISLTGSSRTDSGVHALQNYFHFDFEGVINPASIYNLNAILPGSIVVKNLVQVSATAHSRFDASSREYKYFIYQQKDPFLEEIAFYYPYKLDIELLERAAEALKQYRNFASFSKRGTQVKTFECSIQRSEWKRENDCLVYNVIANRFLRGMVRGLVATMLQVGRGKLSMEEFHNVIESKDTAEADFAVPGHGLFLVSVNYPSGYFIEAKK